MEPLTLDVAIATLGKDGINRTADMTLPKIEGVRYIVSWQNEGCTEIPASLQRPDIEIHTLEGRGVSRNRNNALSHCSADIILNADDDLHYTPQGLSAVIESFTANPDIDFATFRYSGANSHKVYPAVLTSLSTLPKGFSIGTIELAFRRTVIANGVRFDERFGPGTSLATGEDSIMLLTLRRRGYRGCYFPITITHHSGESTGLRPITDRRVALAMGAIIGLEYPLTAPLRLPLKALRLGRSRKMATLPALIELTRGYIRQFFMKKPWKA